MRFRWYTIYEDKEGELYTVAQGFSWLAAIFSFLWAFYHRLWWEGSILLLLSLLWRILFQTHTYTLSYLFFSALAWLAWFILLGSCASWLHERRLIVRGMSKRGTYPAFSAREARLIYQKLAT